MSSHSKFKNKISAGFTALSEMLSTPDVVPAVTPPAPTAPLIDFLTPPIEDTIQFNVREFCAPGAPRGKSHTNAVLPVDHCPKPISSVSSSNDALQHMQAANPELLGFLSNLVSQVTDLKDTIDRQLRDDVSYLSGDSMNTEGSGARKRNRRKRIKKERTQSKTPSRESPLEPTRILQRGETLHTSPATTPPPSY